MDVNHKHVQVDKLELKNQPKLRIQSTGGSRISQTRAPIPKVGESTYYLAKISPENCMKMKQIGSGGGDTSLAPLSL